ncbi:MAG: dipeptidase [Ectobacillus sp.]
MQVFDAHCDVLWQIWIRKERVSFQNDPHLHVTLNGLKEGKGKVQCFALYVPEEVPHERRFEVVLEMIQLFYHEILEKHPDIKLILEKREIQQLHENEIGVILTLEGCDAIGQSLTKLQTLYRLGVRSVGLTWNYGNAVADGVLEPRGAGLSLFGKQVVGELNRLRLWTDVSHLSEKGFWDVMELADFPIASHSNCYSLRKHERNLKDEQIRALIEKKGMVGITFVPSFLTDGAAQIADVIRHLDYICGMGGEKNVGFGSDFDGIVNTVSGLEKFAHYENLLNALLKHYSEEQVCNFTYRNFVRNIPF